MTMMDLARQATALDQVNVLIKADAKTAWQIHQTFDGPDGLANAHRWAWGRSLKRELTVQYPILCVRGKRC